MVVNWHRVCDETELYPEDVIGFEYDGRSYAVYRTPKGYFATDGMCTHEAQTLEDGTVIGTVIECPLHGGRFDIPSGKALSAPVCEDLSTYPVRVDGGEVFVGL
jgi:3-phenylpropionate/trans-cinnamate dioxygenase ferredoxin subunit